jgi:hypothetical protein
MRSYFSATAVTDRAGSRQSADLKTARQIGALPREVAALTEQEVRAVMCAHGAWEVDLRWGLRENSETEDREIERRREAALGACDPAP